MQNGDLEATTPSMVLHPPLGMPQSMAGGWDVYWRKACWRTHDSTPNGGNQC